MLPDDKIRFAAEVREKALRLAIEYGDKRATGLRTADEVVQIAERFEHYMLKGSPLA